MRYLVTGGAGFIGSNIAAELLRQNKDVRVIDNFSTGRKRNLAPLMNRIELVDGDIRDYWTVIEAVKDVDYVLHQAALPSVQRSVQNPLTSNDVNLCGTLNLLEAARQAGVKKFVLASSSSVYGESEELPKHEKMMPSPLSPYAVTKLTCEYYATVYDRLYDLPCVALRYFNVFGPNQDPTSHYSAVIPLFINALLTGNQPVIFGDGLQSRDFTYVSNAVYANILAAESEDVRGEIFNVACGERYTLLDLLKDLNDIIGTDIEPLFDQPRPGDIKHSMAAIDKVETKLGYKMLVGFKEGLEKTVEHFRQEMKTAAYAGKK
ncbi:MAG: NAD-dependent epimerase/dehydratase family protein [candidate division Zixibacteria bacterium]|jgi:UDP-glucose 4-epimerase|nr:NAD-dependent epimerase/dehydratase family protein [candidate division Zixibacteria bacterium]